MRVSTGLGWCIVLFFSLPAGTVSAQVEDHRKGIHSVGIAYRRGSQSLVPVMYEYYLVGISPEIHFMVRRRSAWNWIGFVQPQIAQTRYDFNYWEPADDRSFEAGLSGGLLAGYVFRPSLGMPYVGSAFGPHYIGKPTHRQARGLLFSSQIYAGVQWPIGKRWMIDLRGGFRHISNASLKDPNSGINNSFFQTGIYRRCGLSR